MITKEEILSSEVRALSWKQPFASLMEHGKKETRSWATDYRGLVLICSSVAPYNEWNLMKLAGQTQYMRILQILGKKWRNNGRVVPYGMALYIARLIDCKPWKTPAEARPNETFIEWRDGLHIHTYADVTPIQPFPWKGVQGWKKLTPGERQEIKFISPF